MSRTNPSPINGDTTDKSTDDECDDCDELPAGWPCADCYIAGEPITASGSTLTGGAR